MVRPSIMRITSPTREAQQHQKQNMAQQQQNKAQQRQQHHQQRRWHMQLGLGSAPGASAAPGVTA